MSTKIKGHRIGDGAIGVHHLSPTIKIPESNLGLSYRTHSNEADLTVAQKNTLTLAGNADALHYHTGGGGGPQGIYTNQERDAQLLKLAMMVNADVFGLDKAIVDNFKDDSIVYKGYAPAKAPVLENLCDDPAFPGSLQSDSEYTYGVSFKNHYGSTNVIKRSSVRTGTGFTNAIKLTINDIPEDNTGMSIYRTRGTTEMLLVDESEDKWDNGFGLIKEEFAQDKTSGVSAMAFGHQDSNGTYQKFVAYNMPIIPDVSQPLGTPITDNVPFEFYLSTTSRATIHGIEILWSSTPSYAPRNYEIYYTKDVQIADYETANWEKFENLTPKHVGFRTLDNAATDGVVEESYRIVNNTKAENKFTVNPVEGITYIKIKVTAVDNLCKLTKVNIVDSEQSQRRHFYLDTRGIDLTGFNTLKFDYKTYGNHIPFQVECSRSDEAVSAVNFMNYALTSGVCPEYKDSWQINRIFGQNMQAAMNNYNRVRLTVRIPANTDVRLENMCLRVSTNTSSSYNSTSYYGYELDPFYNIPITWGGKHYLEHFDSDIREISSDWVYIPRKNINSRNMEIVWRHVRGKLYYHGNYGSLMVSTTEEDLGKEDKVNFVPKNNQHYNNYALFKIELGTTNSVSKNITSGYTHDKWHKGYMDIGSVTSLDCLKFFTGSSTVSHGGLVLDNFSITRNKNLLNGTVNVTPTITTGGNINDAITDAYGLSRSKRIEWNQYATVANPQVACFAFDSPHTIGQINITCLNREKTPSNYVIQFSTEPTASVNDGIGSPKWINFTGVTIGEGSFDNGFEGSIRESRIVSNNVSNSTLAHRFHAADVLKVRIFVEGTIGGEIPLIDNIEIYSAVDSEEMKLIYDFDTNMPTSYTLVDDGVSENNILPPELNTTGSCNIMWVKDKNMIEVIDKTTNGVVYTNVIPTDLFQDFMLTAQYLGDAEFEISFDNGASFVQAPLDEVCELPAQTDSIVIRVILGPKASLHAYAMLYSL